MRSSTSQPGFSNAANGFEALLNPTTGGGNTPTAILRYGVTQLAITTRRAALIRNTTGQGNTASSFNALQE
jgi:hypothetical protein